MFESDTIIYILLAILILVVASYFYLDYLETQNVSELPLPLQSEETSIQATQQPEVEEVVDTTQQPVELPLATIEPYSADATPAPV